MSCAPLPADPVRRLLIDDSVSEAPPHEIAKELGALGVLGMHLQGYDCAGADAVSYGPACGEPEARTAGSAASSPRFPRRLGVLVS